ncbi:MAG: hypothetical protein DRI23_04375 [Candidatus Cloacimonadota bacterium]|nr:MAG: hypothetical protein DRI23_04375 [Candidatus Cloacimonadota bacterium]
MKKPIQSKIEYILFLIFYHSTRIWPLPVIKFVAAQVMIFGGMVLGIRKHTAMKNLQMVYPDLSAKDRKKILIGMYKEMGVSSAEVYFGDFNKLYEDVEVEGWENLEKAIAMDKGVIIASCHTGNWELAGRYINRRHKLSVIYKKLRNRYLNDFTYNMRDAEGLIMIEHKKALRQIIKLLKEKYIVTIMIDQNGRKNGVITNFLGHPASTYVGTAKIAIKTQTPIVSAIAIRLPNGKHKFFFEEMILPEGYKNNLQDIKELTERVSAQIEKYILQYPEQWFWVHRRWRGYKKARKAV